MWNEFLPISMPVTATAELSFWDMACSLSGRPLTSLSLVGQEHGRTIPLAVIVDWHTGITARLLWRVSVTDQPIQSFTISCADQNPVDFSHRRRLACSRRFVNRLSATEH